jgi:hypothetical protein
MDGTPAINNNLEALKRLLAGLFAMTGLRFAPEAQSCRASGTTTGGEGRDGAGGSGDPAGRHSKGHLTLPRHLRLVILRLLRPAEAAARRLIIAAARGLVVALPPPRKPRPKPIAAEPLLRRLGIAVVMSPADLARAAAAKRAAVARTALSLSKGPRTLCLPLFDPPRRVPRHGRRYVPRRAAPRILFPGVAEPHRLPPPPSPDDPIDATRLGLRLAALAAALDDLPGQAKRFARWKARNARENTADRPRRTSPLLRGRPPGGRLKRFDPSAVRPRNVREVDEILAHAHALAIYALERPDTS